MELGFDPKLSKFFTLKVINKQLISIILKNDLVIGLNQLCIILVNVLKAIEMTENTGTLFDEFSIFEN